MSTLRDTLFTIQTGQRSFRPDGDTLESIEAFQPTAKALRHALDQRFIPDAKFRTSKGRETHGKFLGAIVVGDLTYAGESYLASTESLAVENVNNVAIKLFLSHASQDEQLVTSILSLIKAALLIEDREIRCTSIQGHRFRGGTDVDEQLRNELKAAPAFVGIITPNSLTSVYVLFEIGARWGGGHHLIPLTCLPLSQDRLPGPMGGLHFLRLQLRRDLNEFVEELAGLLGKEAPLPANYAAELEGLLAVATAAAAADV